MKRFSPSTYFLGGYTDNDGTVEFYGRIRNLVDSQKVILDLGAGRGSWYSDSNKNFKFETRNLRGAAKRVIGIDVDSAVLQNRSTDENRLIKGSAFPVEGEAVDIVVADYVLEHVMDPAQFASEINRVLKPGGYFCARTPSVFHYASIGNALFRFLSKNPLRQLQPSRKKADVFPAFYRCNTLSRVEKLFPGWKSYSYYYRSEPAYFLENRYIYEIFKQAHRVAPIALVGNLFVFLKKAG